MRKIREVLRLKSEARLSDRQIAAVLGTARSTVQECLRRARDAGLGWPLPADLDEDALLARLYPQTAARDRYPAPDFATVHAELARKGVTRMLLWQEYKARHPDGCQYSAFCRDYDRWRGRQGPVMRFEHAPGDKLFVDYAGQTMAVVDRHSGAVQVAQIFVAAQGASHYTYVEATFTQTVADWLGAHVRRTPMLTQPLLQQLHELRLRGMAAALEQQLATPQTASLTFDERFGLLLQHELVERQSCRLRQRLRWARLTQSAALEDLDLKAARGLDRAALAQVTDLAWIAEHLNVLITGPTGVGKSFLACALGHAACRADHSVRCFRLPRLIDELTRHAALQNKSTFLRQLAKAELLILDDFGLTPLPEPIRRDLLEILDDRYDRKATLITSQLPIEQWHAYLGDPTLADAILDRLIRKRSSIHRLPG